MRLSNLLVTFSALLWCTTSTSDGLQDVVTWDPYSIIINSERVFIYAGEFHYQRMPVPEMWLDIFQKFKANGFNTVSIYFFWSYHSASEGVYDFTTSGKNVQKVLDYAKDAGLYVIARPGPYCNAETNGGGLALWGSDGGIGKIRTDNETYYESWLPFMQQIGAILAANQITNGGPVILTQVENELQETTHASDNTLVLYMEQIEKVLRDAGITVPFTSNEKGERSESWSVDYEDVGGAVNMYGLDSYPGGTSCTNPTTGYSVVQNYFQWFANYSFTQPNYFPEFEGGYFQPWGGHFYDGCAGEHSPDFPDLYYKNNIGQRTTLQSLYMAFGGTNWGHSAAPVVYTSYDYSAPLRETRQIQTKMSQTKLVGLFTRVSTDLLKTYMVGNGTGYTVSSTGIWTWVLRNPDTQAGFTVVQQYPSSSTASVTFSADLTTTQGVVTVPNVSLNGRQSKILVTDYKFGSHSLLYSSADILTYGVFDDADVLVLYLDEGQTGQFAFNSNSSHLSFNAYGTSGLNSTRSNGTQTFTYTQGAGQTMVKFSNNVLLYLLDQPTAWKFWAPSTISNPNVEPDEQIFVLGPYLVRSASISDDTVHVIGDSDNTTSIEVYAGSKASRISWNGKSLTTKRTTYGSLAASIPGAEDRIISLPKLMNWHSGDSLPEIDPAYDDSNWTICNKTTTLASVAPITFPVLYSSDYGFYTGAKIYRGYFDNAFNASSSINITASGGLAFGWNAWLNGVLIGGNLGNASLTTTSAILFFPPSSLKGTHNVLTVVVDYHGHDEASTANGVENPRGILGTQLLTSTGAVSNATFTQWKIQGNAGGSANIDPVRGPMNEGGLYAERLGWFLPGFPAASYLNSTSSPLEGISKSGIRFYTTTFDLNIDADLDAPLGISLSSDVAKDATTGQMRVMIWVNGYQYGKYVPAIGPQSVFPVPPGVINNRGSNTLGVGLWAMTDEGARLTDVSLVSYGTYVSGFEGGFAGEKVREALQPGWDVGRLSYK